MSDNEIYIPGYTLWRSDRDRRVGGGTLAYIRDALPCCTRSDLQASNIESSVIEINRKKQENLLYLLYIKLLTKKLELFLEGLSNMLRIFPSESDIITCILGDFNVNVLATK